MKLLATTISALVLAVAVAACGGDAEDEPLTTQTPSPSAPTVTPTLEAPGPPSPTVTSPAATPTAAPTTAAGPTPRPGAEDAPSGVVSGVPEIDAIIADLLAGDVDAFAGHFVLFDTTCTTAQGLGGPPKCADFPGPPPDGSPVSAFPYATCEGAWTADVEGLAAALLASQLGTPRPDPSLPSGSPPALFGVAAFETPQPLYANEPGFPSFDHLILLEYTMAATGRVGVALAVGEGQIVSTSTVCIGPPEMVLDRYDGYEIILKGPAYR